ncbi:MAG: phage-type endonuclease [Gemmatimonadetes bacterium]|nr:phage-type endonuclease [Gemmatimonadota bacterium]
MTASVHHVAGISFSDEQLEDRRKTLGASEVPAVLGLDRYKSPHDIWLSKRGLVPPFAGNEHTEWGLRVEPAIRQKVADTLGVEIDMPGSLVHPIDSWMSATPDGLFMLDGVSHVLEIKNKSDRQSVHWGVSGTDQVPTDISAQVYWQLLVTGLREAKVAVLFGKSDFRMYHLSLDMEVGSAVLDQCREFWTRHIVGGVEPEIGAGPQTAEYLKAKFATHGDVLRDATREEDKLISELRSVREAVKVLEANEEVLKHQLMAVIGSDAGIVGRSGRVTWKAPDGVTTKWKEVAMALNAPADLIAKYSTPQARKFLPTFPKE